MKPLLTRSRITASAGPGRRGWSNQLLRDDANDRFTTTTRDSDGTITVISGDGPKIGCSTDFSDGMHTSTDFVDGRVHVEVEGPGGTQQVDVNPDGSITAQGVDSTGAPYTANVDPQHQVTTPGANAQTTTNPDGSRVTNVQLPDGTTVNIDEEPNGSSATSVSAPDRGTTVTVSAGKDGAATTATQTVGTGDKAHTETASTTNQPDEVKVETDDGTHGQTTTTTVDRDHKDDKGHKETDVEVEQQSKQPTPDGGDTREAGPFSLAFLLAATKSLSLMTQTLDPNIDDGHTKPGGLLDAPGTPEPDLDPSRGPIKPGVKVDRRLDPVDPELPDDPHARGAKVTRLSTAPTNLGKDAAALHSTFLA